MSGSTITWTLTAGGTNGIRLVVGTGPQAVEVAGNPHGAAQAGGDLAIVDYDGDDDGSGGLITNIYTVDIAALVGKTSGGDLTVTANPIDANYLPEAPNPLPAGTTFKVHGNGLIALTDTSGNTFYYAQYNGAIEDSGHMPVDYVNGAVVRLPAANLSQQTSAPVGKNTMGMVPLPIPAPGGTTSGLAIAAPGIGGTIKSGETNGANSTVYRIDDIFGTMTSVPALVGDATTAFTAEGTRDFKSVAFSDDGLFGYVLTVTYNGNYKASWKLYQTAAANILGISNVPISTAIDKNLLVLIDQADGVDGIDWEVVYENAALPRNGRLWFVKGTTFQVSQGSLYSNYAPFDKLYDGSINGIINSADLIGEMIYQYGKGHSIETRLIKGKTVAKIARAAAASAAPADEEDK
jgi:hypothetical protein